MMEGSGAGNGSGAGSVLVTDKSVCGSRRPKKHTNPASATLRFTIKVNIFQWINLIPFLAKVTDLRPAATPPTWAGIRNI